MKEDVLEVLLFIFDHFSEDNSEFTEQDEDLSTTLEQCGFGKDEVEKALLWLDDLVELRDSDYSKLVQSSTAFRIYTHSEQEKLDADCRGFIFLMEKMAVLDFQSREMVIDRAIALEGEAVDLERLKWVIKMVLYNIPDREGEYALAENLDMEYQLH